MTVSRFSNIGGGIQEMGRVIHALILRDMRTRFGRHHLGYIWAFLEPIITVGPWECKPP